MLLGEKDGLGTGEKIFERAGIDFLVTFSLKNGGADCMALCGGVFFFLSLMGVNYVFREPSPFFEVIFIS